MDRIYDKANKTSPCYLISNNRIGNVLKKDVKTLFAVLPNLSVDYLTRLVQTFLQRDTYSESSFKVFESIRTFIVRKTLKREEKCLFERHLNSLKEHGVIEKVYSNVPNFFGIELAKRGGKDGFEHYESLQAYTADHTMVVALPFRKLDYLFRLYYGFLATVLFVYLIHHLWRVLPIRRALHWFRSIKSRFLLFVAKVLSQILSDNQSV